MRELHDRVGLAAQPDWVGEVSKVHRDGTVDVTLDLGGKARGMREDDLVDEKPKDDEPEKDTRERDRATSDKSWPPSTMETKVPRQTGAK